MICNIFETISSKSNYLRKKEKKERNFTTLEIYNSFFNPLKYL